MKDYRVTVKVRNNRILKAIELAGGTPGGKWCEAQGISYPTLNNLINMTESPANAAGELRPIAIKLCDILNATPDDLWSSEQLYPLEKNFSEMEMDYAQVMAMLPSAEQTYLLDESGVEQRQARTALDKAVSTLTQREQEVLRYRFDDDMSLCEVAKRMGLSRERVRQHEAKALRTLRHPSRAAGIIEFADVSDVEIEDVKARHAAAERHAWIKEQAEKHRALKVVKPLLVEAPAVSERNPTRREITLMMHHAKRGVNGPKGMTEAINKVLDLMPVSDQTQRNLFLSALVVAFEYGLTYYRRDVSMRFQQPKVQP